MYWGTCETGPNSGHNARHSKKGGRFLPIKIVQRTNTPTNWTDTPVTRSVSQEDLIWSDPTRHLLDPWERVSACSFPAALPPPFNPAYCSHRTVTVRRVPPPTADIIMLPYGPLSH